MVDIGKFGPWTCRQYCPPDVQSKGRAKFTKQLKMAWIYKFFEKLCIDRQIIGRAMASIIP
jgi:hypothetical protein